MVIRTLIRAMETAARMNSGRCIAMSMRKAEFGEDVNVPEGKSWAERCSSDLSDAHGCKLTSEPAVWHHFLLCAPPCTSTKTPTK